MRRNYPHAHTPDHHILNPDPIRQNSQAQKTPPFKYLKKTPTRYGTGVFSLIARTPCHAAMRR